jgi:hypothetical protein
MTVTNDILVKGRGRLTTDETLEFIVECTGGTLTGARLQLANLVLSGPAWELAVSNRIGRFSHISYDRGTGFFWVRPA